MTDTLTIARHPTRAQIIRWAEAALRNVHFGVLPDALIRDFADGLPALAVEQAVPDDDLLALAKLEVDQHLSAENRRLSAERDASRAREAELQAALRPFAEYMHTDEGRLDCDYFCKPLPDDLTVGWIYLTHGDFRRARAALNPTGDTGA